jgi:hypothetical protein
MYYNGAYSATNAFVVSSLEEAKKKAYDLMLDYYNQYCEDFGKEQEFEIVPCEKSEKSSYIMIDAVLKYTYTGGYGEIVTISKA